MSGLFFGLETSSLPVDSNCLKNLGRKLFSFGLNHVQKRLIAGLEDVGSRIRTGSKHVGCRLGEGWELIRRRLGAD